MKIEKESKVKESKKEVTKTEPEDLAYAKKLAQLKKQYRKIYETNIAGEKILWRPLKRSEYKDMLNMEFPEGTSEEDKTYDRETFIAKCVVLYPEEVVEDTNVENATETKETEETTEA